MRNFLTPYYMDKLFSLPMAKAIFFVFAIAIISSFFSMALSAAMLFFIFLFSLILAGLFKFKINKKELFILLAAGFLVHATVISLIYFTGFRPVGGGADYESYHSMAKEFSRRIWVGNFDLYGVRGGHDFTLLVGGVYALFYPDILVANVLIVWFFCLSLIFSYLIITEMGGSGKLALLAGILISLYPSYLYFGSLLLKDTLVIPLVLLAMWLCIKMLKEFSWAKFLLFFIILTPIIHLRFYIGYAVMFSFLASWFLVSNFKRKRLYGFYILFLLGFSPFILGNGYYGMDVMHEFINPEQITIYREIVYNPDSPRNESVSQILPTQPIPGLNEPKVQNPLPQPVPKDEVQSGFGSSFVVETGLGHGPLAFIKNSLTSFTYGLLGPFPWQLRYQRQYIAFFETIPWYLILIVFGCSFLRAVKEKNIQNLIREKKVVIVLILFGVFGMAGLSLFINNYGILMRVRIPVIISFILAGFIIFNNYLENFLKKVPWLKNI